MGSDAVDDVEEDEAAVRLAQHDGDVALDHARDGVVNEQKSGLEEGAHPKNTEGKAGDVGDIVKFKGHAAIHREREALGAAGLTEAGEEPQFGIGYGDLTAGVHEEGVVGGVLEFDTLCRRVGGDGVRLRRAAALSARDVGRRPALVGLSGRLDAAVLRPVPGRLVVRTVHLRVVAAGVLPVG